MNKFDELLEVLQKEEIKQTECWEESIPTEIWDNYFMKSNYKVLKTNVDRDEHRWYVVSTIVIRIFDRLLGIRAVTNLMSESMDYESCYHTLEFFEMEKTKATSYSYIKKNN